MSFGGAPVSRTAAFSRLVSLGLRDLIAELTEQAEAGEDGAQQPAHAQAAFIAPSPPRGSRWATAPVSTGSPDGAGRAAPAGFIRLTTMIVARELVDEIDATRALFDRVIPGKVASRAALVREALARGVAAQDAQERLLEEMRRMADETPPGLPRASFMIPRDVLFPRTDRASKPPEQDVAPRPATRRRAAQARGRRTKRTTPKGADADDGEPPPLRPPAFCSSGRRSP
ncbi:MAG: hypothetical protein Q8S73_19865 [Deltaproteobacteria bacterium]|nr:hypothetical protein [Deltaproteobacteria bacterium]